VDLYAAHLDDVNHGKAVPHRKKEPSTQGVREGGQRTPNSVWLLAGRASRNGRARSLLHGGNRARRTQYRPYQYPKNCRRFRPLRLGFAENCRNLRSQNLRLDRWAIVDKIFYRSQSEVILIHQKLLRFGVLLGASILLSACTTVDFDQRLQSCWAPAYQMFPVKHITVQRLKTESYEEFDGTVICDDSLSTPGTGRIRCTQGTIRKTRQVPYTVVVDANEELRGNYAQQCAKQRCITEFGNESCDRNVKNSSPISSHPNGGLQAQQAQAKQVLANLIPGWMASPQIRNTQGFGTFCGNNGWKVLEAWGDITDVVRYPNQIKIEVGSLWKAGIPCSVWVANIPVSISESDFHRLRQAFKALGADIK